MKVLLSRCLKCNRNYLKIVLNGEFFYLVECLKCKEKFRVMKSEVARLKIEVIEHE